MPAAAPPSGPHLKKLLEGLGQRVRTRRKELKVSAIATAEAAGLSRMTLNRIERGEASVTIGAYLNVISVLGLELKLTKPSQSRTDASTILIDKNTKIHLADYPQLKKLAWQIKKSKTLTPREALNIYERNWRHIDLEKIKREERNLINSLLAYFGKERLLV